MTYAPKQVFGVTQLFSAPVPPQYSCPRSMHTACFGGHFVRSHRGQDLVHDQLMVLAKDARFVSRLFNDAAQYMCYTFLNEMRLPRVVSRMQVTVTQCLRTALGWTIWLYGLSSMDPGRQTHSVSFY
jgi:hypothetical protein